MTSSIPSSEGTAYIISSIMLSIIERRPLAPVFLSIAFEAMAESASGVKESFTPSRSRSLTYCLIIEFLGSVRMRISIDSSRSSRVTVTGIRPTSSGIRPYLTISCDVTFLNFPSLLLSSFVRTLLEYPIVLRPFRFSMIFSRPSKAPPQIKSIFSVFICMNSWLGCLRPP